MSDNSTPIDRAKLIASVQFRMVALTDQALAGLAAFVDLLPTRPIDSASLNEAQWEREGAATK